MNGYIELYKRLVEEAAKNDNCLTRDEISATAGVMFATDTARSYVNRYFRWGHIHQDSGCFPLHVYRFDPVESVIAREPSGDAVANMLEMLRSSSTFTRMKSELQIEASVLTATSNKALQRLSEDGMITITGDLVVLNEAYRQEQEPSCGLDLEAAVEEVAPVDTKNTIQIGAIVSRYEMAIRATMEVAEKPFSFGGRTIEMEQFPDRWRDMSRRIVAVQDVLKATGPISVRLLCAIFGINTSSFESWLSKTACGVLVKRVNGVPLAYLGPLQGDEHPAPTMAGELEIFLHSEAITPDAFRLIVRSIEERSPGSVLDTAGAIAVATQLPYGRVYDLIAKAGITLRKKGAKALDKAAPPVSAAPIAPAPSSAAPSHSEPPTSAVQEQPAAKFQRLATEMRDLILANLGNPEIIASLWTHLRDMGAMESSIRNLMELDKRRNELIEGLRKSA